MTIISPDTPVLLSKKGANEKIAQLLSESSSLTVEVHEDKCFESKKWLSLGTVNVQEYALGTIEENGWGKSTWHGQFDWVIPNESDITDGLRQASGSNLNSDLIPRVVKSITEALQDIARRLCLLLPTFGADDVSRLPFSRPTTLVLDTSAVIQGGLAFATKFLYPMARIKVPAVVGLEVRNMADTYLAIRHSLGSTSGANAKRARVLGAHVRSQGAERALMRLELGSDVEVERPLEGSDPLRIIFKQDTEDGFRDLNLTRVQRSLADRLIFETAREHMRRLSAGQEVCVFTSDQGLARTALAEGMNPLYFDARRTTSVLGVKLSGTRFAPFNGKLYSVPLPSLVWEMATCFGSCRLRTDDGCEFRVTAIGETLTWASYHSKDDLLWCSWVLPEPQEEHEVPADPSKKSEANKDRGISERSSSTASAEVTEAPATVSIQDVGAAVPSPKPERITAYSFSPERLFTFATQLAERTTLDQQGALESLGTDKTSVLNEYRKLLVSGGLAHYAAPEFRATQGTVDLARSIEETDLDEMGARLMQIPSFKRFFQYLESHGQHPDWADRVPMRKGVVAGYRGLVEVAALGIDVPGQGFCLTSGTPGLKQFAGVAQLVYDELSALDDPLVLTGQWLERLSCEYGVHPVTARDLLARSFDDGLLKRYFEGSTPDSRFSKHTLDVLETVEGSPTIERYHLYDGTFLRSERSSVRLKIESASN